MLAHRACIYSPNAQQVEGHVLNTESTVGTSAQTPLLHTDCAKSMEHHIDIQLLLEKPRTRSIARAKNFTASSPCDISDSENETYSNTYQRHMPVLKVSTNLQFLKVG